MPGLQPDQLINDESSKSFETFLADIFLEEKFDPVEGFVLIVFRNTSKQLAYLLGQPS